MSSLAARRAGPTAARTPATEARTTITVSCIGGTTRGMGRSPSMAEMIPNEPATANRGQQIVGVDVLEQEAAGAGPEGVEDVLVEVEGGEDDHPGVGQALSPNTAAIP